MTYVSLSARSGLATVCMRIAFSAIASALAAATLIILFSSIVQADVREIVQAHVKEPRGGLFFKDEAGLRPAPQPATEVRIHIGGIVARIDVVQYFHNPYDEWQEGVYVFPLPDDGAVDRVRLKTGDRLDRLDGELAVGGRRAGKVWQSTLDLSTAKPLGGVAKVWARDKMRDLEDSVHDGVDHEVMRVAVTRLAVAHQLMSPYTSLVAVDRTHARPADKAVHRRDVPTNLPHGMSREKVTGETVAGEIPAAFQAGLQPASFNLPQGATPATLKLLAGLALIVFAIGVALLGGRRCT